MTVRGGCVDRNSFTATPMQPFDDRKGRQKGVYVLYMYKKDWEKAHGYWPMTCRWGPPCSMRQDEGIPSQATAGNVHVVVVIVFFFFDMPRVGNAHGGSLRRRRT